MERTKFKTESLSSLFLQLKDLHRKRQDCMKPRVAIINQLEAINRRMKAAKVSKDIIKVHIDNVKKGIVISEAEKAYEKQMIKIGERLPLHDWYCQNKGCSDIGFCMLLAEIGNMSNYSNPAKVWKRMGLAVQNGRAEKNTVKGQNTGYSPHRRAIAYMVSSSIIKTNGHYREVYDVRKAYEIERNQNGDNAEYVETNRVKMLAQFDSKENKDLIKNNQLPKAVIDLRAQRYMVKRLLCDMWNEWNKN